MESKTMRTLKNLTDTVSMLAEQETAGIRIINVHADINTAEDPNTYMPRVLVRVDGLSGILGLTGYMPLEDVENYTVETKTAYRGNIHYYLHTVTLWNGIEVDCCSDKYIDPKTALEAIKTMQVCNACRESDCDNCPLHCFRRMYGF